MPSNMLSQKQSESLAEMLYLFEMKMAGKETEADWKKMDEGFKDVRRKTVENFVENLDKIGFEPRPLNEFRMSRQNISTTKDSLTSFIKNYIVKNIKTPKNLSDIFPSGELASRIVDAYGPDRKDQ